MDVLSVNEIALGTGRIEFPFPPFEVSLEGHPVMISIVIWRGSEYLATLVIGYQLAQPEARDREAFMTGLMHG